MAWLEGVAIYYWFHKTVFTKLTYVNDLQEDYESITCYVCIIIMINVGIQLK